jgi:membrane fusion protein, copper/silver efflux system
MMTHIEHPDAGDDVRATSRPSPARRTLRLAAIVGAPLLAIAVAWWATRDAASSDTATGHDHATVAAGGDSARTVSLNAVDQRRIGVTFAPVTLGALGREVRTVGQVAVDETRVRTITTKVDGWVERLHVDFTGQLVERGAPLLSLYSPMLVTAQEELLVARRLGAEVAEGSAETREGAADLAAAARRRLAWWDVPAEEIARIERTGQVQRTITLRAPAGGFVLEKNVTAGQRVMAGEPLYRVADLSSVWVEAEVYEQDLRAVAVGRRVRAEFDALPGEVRAGRVAYVYPTLSAETRTARVRVALPNPGLRLKPGMYATLLLEGASVGATLSVPRGAVLATGERQLVFVRGAGGQLEPREVQTGNASDERIEILGGLALGDTVVASATFLIDAESNLGTAMGGMGDMPGMEITTPPANGWGTARARRPAPPTPAPAPSAMPGMEMPATKPPTRPAPAKPSTKPSTPPADAHAGHGRR